MKTTALVLSTLALGTTTLTTGCDKNLPSLAALVQKAQAVKHDLLGKVATLGGPRLGAFGEDATPGAGAADPTPDFAPGYAPGLAMPEGIGADGLAGRITGNFDLSFAFGPGAAAEAGNVGDIAAMNQAFDQRFDQQARAASWDLALQIPNDVQPSDLAAQLRANADQAAAGEAYIQDQQDQSDRRVEAVEAWDRQVIRGESE